MKDTTVIAEAMKRFKLSKAASDPQRERENDDLAFQIPENQWTDAAIRGRQGSGTIPSRPHLSISKLEQPIQLIVNQQKSAHLGVQIHPVSPEADVETASMLQGLYRSIERDSRANIARGWAFERAVKAGTGYYRVTTEYDEESDNPFDQKILIDRILHQESVYLDPSAQLPDWSDGEYAFICSWVPMDRYKREYGKTDLAGYTDDALLALQGEMPEWVQVGGEERTAVLVAEYFRKTYQTRTWVELTSGGYAFEDEIDDGDSALEGGRRRTTSVPTVTWSVINGVEEITPAQAWNGRYIPIVPVIGRELQPFDKDGEADRYFVGMIGPAKDGQRLYNYAATNAVEIGALEPRAPWIMYEGQDEGYEPMWQESNTRNYPVLKVKQVTLTGGSPAPLPQRVPIDGSRLNVSMQLLQQANDYIQATTSVFDPSLGRGGSDRSGRAVQALQQQSDAGTSHYLDNLAQISMTYEAKIVLDLIPAVYDRPGRVVQLVNGEDDTDAAMMTTPFFLDPMTQRPMPVPPEGVPMPGLPMPGMGPPGMPPPGMLPPGMGPIPGPMPGPMPGGGGMAGGPPLGGLPQPGGGGMPLNGASALPPPPAPPKVQVFDLRKGTYGVSVSVGRSFQTRLDEGAAEIGQILQTNPGLLPLIGPLYFRYRDFPGSQEIAELLKKERQHMMPWLDQEDGNNIDAMTAQIQQLTEQGQQVQEELAKATEYIKTEQAKWAAQAAIAQGKADVQLHIQSMRDATSIAVEELRALTKSAVQDEKGQQEMSELLLKQRHARDMAAGHIVSSQHTQAMKAAHDREMEGLKVEGEITHDAVEAEIDVARDRAENQTPEVSVDVEVPVTPIDPRTM